MNYYVFVGCCVMCNDDDYDDDNDDDVVSALCCVGCYVIERGLRATVSGLTLTPVLLGFCCWPLQQVMIWMILKLKSMLKVYFSG